MSQQYQNFREQLRAAGCTLSTIEQHGGGIDVLRVHRPEGHPVRVVIFDTENDGYTFYIEGESNAISDDVEAILSHGKGVA